MDIPVIPNYAYNEDETLERKLNDTAGINEVSRGQLPSASIPAIGMQFLVEQDDTRIGIMTEQHEHAYADLGRIILKFAAANYSTERTLKVAGDHNEYIVKKFTGGDIKTFDVKVVRGSTLPGSKVLRRQEILNLFQQGLLGPMDDPATVEKVLNMLEYGWIEGAWKKQSLNNLQFQKFIRMIEQGQRPPVSEFDDHAFMIRKFNEYRVSDKFDKLDDESQQLVLDTMNEHLEHIMNMTQPQAANAGMPDPAMEETTAAEETLNEMTAGPAEGIEEVFPQEELPEGETEL